MRRVAVLVLLAGCRQIFGLHELAARDGGSGDAPGGGSDARDSAVDAIADAYPDAPAGFFRVGGMVTGLATPATLVLRDNGGDDLTLHANGAFQFATPIQTGLAYAVTVHTQPRDQNCVVSNGTGMIGSSDVASVTVSCSAQLGIECNGTVCDPSTLLCCSQTSGFSCVSNQTSQCATDVPIECDDARECPGQYCCAAYDGTNKLKSGLCSTGASHACQSPIGGSSTYFCDPDDIAGTCPAGFTRCIPSTITGVPPGYYQCAP